MFFKHHWSATVQYQWCPEAKQELRRTSAQGEGGDSLGPGHGKTNCLHHKTFQRAALFDHHAWFDKKHACPHITVLAICTMKRNHSACFQMLSVFFFPSPLVCVCVCPGQGRFTTAKRSKAIASWGMSTIAPQKLNTLFSIIWSCNQCNKQKNCNSNGSIPLCQRVPAKANRLRITRWTCRILPPPQSGATQPTSWPRST